MTKSKIPAILAAVVALALIFALCAVHVVEYYKKIGETGLHDTLPYGFGKKARVILLAGQSNAAGCSRDEYLKMNVTPEEYAKYEDGFDNVYINHFASATNVSHAFVKCEARQGEWGGFFGPELGLAEKLSELYPDETFFIVKYAWGGTNLYEQWRSPSGGNTGPLYQSFVEYVRVSLTYLELKGYDVEIEAMCWMQGESDSIEEDKALEYETNLGNLVEDIRTDFAGYAAEDGIAFVDAYIAATIFWKHYTVINAAKAAVADRSAMNVAIDTVSHGLSVTEEPYDEPDIAHYDSLSEIKLGHLFAEAVSGYLS